MPERSERPSREAFIDATARLLRRQGYSATGLNEVVAVSGAPKGSLYFHFKGGKQELAVAAMERSGGQLRDAIAATLSSQLRLGAALGALIDAMAAGLRASGYRDGCPIATVTLEASGGSERIRATAEGVFDSWLEVLEQRLLQEGMDKEQAGRRALLVLCALEGGLLLARARRDPGPLEAVREELVALAG